MKQPSLKERIGSKLRCLSFNFFPCYRGSGGKVAWASSDWRSVTVKLPLSWRTRNYVGTIFGGSMYAAIDPIYMLMLIKNLGSGYIVWDKAASIRFKKPGKSTLHAEFNLSEQEIELIKSTLKTERSTERTYLVQLVDQAGTVCAEFDKVVYVRKA